MSGDGSGSPAIDSVREGTLRYSLRQRKSGVTNGAQRGAAHNCEVTRGVGTKEIPEGHLSGKKSGAVVGDPVGPIETLMCRFMI